MASIFFIVFVAVFLLVLTAFAAILVGSLKQRRADSSSPRLTVDALIVSRRQNVSKSRHANAGDVTGAHGYSTASFTSYYVTFQVESGDRMEFSVPGSQYGLLAEGDSGRLTFQGTRFLSFERK